MTESTETIRGSVVVVTGLSGAGRSTALSALEDLGFFCVDNLPPSAFAPCLEACARDRLQRVAIGIDVRVRAFLDGTLAAIDEVRRDASRQFQLLFLDASDATLQARFSATRRPHPLRAQEDGSIGVLDGIQIERRRLAPLRANASVVVDTSSLTVHELRHRIIELFRDGNSHKRGMAARFVSFGFKYGAPSDVDMMFDVRFLHNPYFIPELRPFSGLDEPVRNFVRENPTAQTFVTQAEQLLSFLLPQYEKEGKSYFTLGIGCTGGRHRSVATAVWLAERLSQSHSIEPKVEHRDIARFRTELEPARSIGGSDDAPTTGGHS
jgi:UPF0042 nucleotide-binding protein